MRWLAVAALLLSFNCRETVLPDRHASGAPAFALQPVSVAGEQLYVPSGFNVNLFAEQLDGARSLALGPGGAVFVALSNSGQVVRLVDTDGDGVADVRSTVLSGLDTPFGMAFRGDTGYLAEQTTVKRFDPGASSPVTIISNLPSGGHVTRTIAFGPDNRLYVAIGSSCNVCDDPLPRAAVTRYNLDGSGAHTFASGLRNSVGLAFNPTTGELWANNNDRDNLSDDLPPEHLNILRDGRWYGWPQCYLPGKPNPEYPLADCSAVEPPAFTFQAHSAPLGLAFYTGAMFPTEYRGDAFMTYHGSWNRTVPTGDKVVRVVVQNGQPAAIEDFVTGWQRTDGSRWGRPVSLLVMPDGALLVSDDYGGRIWRVTFGQSPPPEPGSIAINTATTGSSVDPDGYTVTVDGTTSQPIGTNASVTFTGVSAGSHTVVLSGVAGNCTVSGGTSRTVNVTAGSTASTSYSVSCASTTPTTGNLTVTTATTGASADLDPDGYTVTLDGTTSRAIGINASVSFTGLSAGSHTVVLSGVAGNCTVSGGTSRTVNVTAGSTATTSYSVSCAPTGGGNGSLTVTTTTTGAASDIDPDGYTVVVDGGAASQPIPANGSVTFTGPAGDHTVALTGVASNCTVSGANPRSVTVPAGGTTTTGFSVSCGATSGNLTVSTSTGGSSLDPDGYTVTLDGTTSRAIGVNANATFSGLSAGSHTVVLSGVAGNCAVSGGTSRTVTVPSGGTATAAFTVSCTATTGNLSVATSSTGSGIPASYTLSASGPGGSTTQAIGANTSVTFSAIATGDYTVALSDVPSNCTLSGANPRTVTVPSGGTGSTTFAVSCGATSGNLTVSTSTGGSTLDPDGYTVTVDGSQSQVIGINSSATFTNLAAGGHTVVLSGVAGNCAVSGGTSRTVTVPSGGTATAAFTVSCSTPPGNLTVTTSTSGSSLPSGYTVTVDGTQSQAIGTNSSVTFTNLSAGGHTVGLSSVASNCSVSGGTSRTVTVPSGGTVTASFGVSCVTPNRPPVVNAGSNQAVLLGVLYTLPDASFSDPDNDGPWSYTITWGDGSSSSGSLPSQGSISGSHNYLLLGTYQITVRVTDSHGASGSASKALTVGSVSGLP